MAGDPFYCLGKILKPHGNKGHLLVHLDVGNPGDYENIRSVYVDLDGERIPYLAEVLEIRNNGNAILRFEDITTIGEAEPLTGKKLYLPVAVLPVLDENQFYFHEVTGFTVIDKTLGAIGIVGSVIEMQYQSLLQVKHQDREILIPLVDEIVKTIDRETRTILIEAPDGLIGIYL
ncbi:MAG: ribosome maturation factor RimM [bacterium]